MWAHHLLLVAADATTSNDSGGTSTTTIVAAIAGVVTVTVGGIFSLLARDRGRERRGRWDSEDSVDAQTQQTLGAHDAQITNNSSRIHDLEVWRQTVDRVLDQLGGTK